MRFQRLIFPRPFLLLLGVAASLVPGTALTATLLESAAAFAQPALGGAGVDAAGRTFRFGHLQLSFTSGRLFPVQAGPDLAGVFFVGEGSFRYVSIDPLEAPSYRTNVRRNSGYSVDNEGVIRDGVRRVLLLVSEGAEELAGPEARQGEAPSAAVEALKDHVGRYSRDLSLRPAQLMPLALREPPGERVVLAEIEARKEDLLFVYDTLRDGDESLWALRKLVVDYGELRGSRVGDLLSSQPIGRTRLDPRPKRFFLRDVDLSLTNPEKQKARLEVRETFEAAARIRTLNLDLWSRRISSAGIYPWQLESVTAEDGTPVLFSHIERSLLVELPRPLDAGQRVTLVFRASGDVLYRPSGDNYWELPTDAWLPLPRLDLQSFTYHAVVRVARPFLPFSCGRTVRRWEEGELSAAEFREEKPISIPVIIAGRYTVKTETRSGVTVTVASYALSKAAGGQKLIGITFDLLDFYQHYLGPFPFSEVTIIEINSYGFGQAPAGLIRITKEAFNPLGDEVAKAFSIGINERVAHELAHTWWGHVAKLGNENDAWMSESLAQYYAASALAKAWQKSKFDDGIVEWKRWSLDLSDQGTVYLASQLSGPDGPRDRAGLLYGKGPLVLHAFRKEVGDDAFFTIFKSYLKSFPFREASTKNLIALASFVAKRDVKPWFETNLMGVAWPK